MEHILELWAIIPVKPFELGKSRLAAMLGPAERAALNRQLFDRVFDVALRQLGTDRVIVVTTDAALVTRVRRKQAHAVAERSTGDLNAALAQASRYASACGAQAILVLPSDLPDIAAADIAALRAAIEPPPSCVIAPDALEQGTNALALAPPAADVFRFGPHSFAAHLKEARMRGLRTRIVRRPGLARDLDTPEAYRRFAGRCRRTPALTLKANEPTSTVTVKAR